jgi:hypothetical protein
MSKLTEIEKILMEKTKNNSYAHIEQYFNLLSGCSVSDIADFLALVFGACSLGDYVVGKLTTATPYISIQFYDKYSKKKNAVGVALSPDKNPDDIIIERFSGWGFNLVVFLRNDIKHIYIYIPNSVEPFERLQVSRLLSHYRDILNNYRIEKQNNIYRDFFTAWF